MIFFIFAIQNVQFFMTRQKVWISVMSWRQKKLQVAATATMRYL